MLSKAVSPFRPHVQMNYPPCRYFQDTMSLLALDISHEKSGSFQYRLGQQIQWLSARVLANVALFSMLLNKDKIEDHIAAF